MYTVLRAVPLRTLATQLAPSALMAAALAESFYRFHSFTLECAAFLATWYAIDFAMDRLRRWADPSSSIR